MLAIERSAQYKRHRPETTQLYQLVERYYPEFTANLAEQGKYLPKYVEREFDEYLRCGLLHRAGIRFILLILAQHYQQNALRFIKDLKPQLES